MGVFGAVFGRRGDAGFSGPLLGLSRGDAGFNVALLSRLVREKVRPVWPDGGREREKVRPARSKHPKVGVLWRAGRVFRGNSSGEALVGELIRGGAAGAVVLGELFRGRVAGGVVLGELIRGRTAGGVVLGELIRGGAAGGGVLGKFADRLSWDPTEPVLMQRAPGRALLLAASTLRYAATPT